MRPDSIVMFERLFLASLAVSMLSFLIGYDEMMAALAREPAMQEIGLGSGFIIGVVGASYAIYLLLWVLIVHKAANFAKWILVVFVAIGFVSVPMTLTGPWNLTALLGLAVYALELAAVVYLFRADAKAWFKGEQSADPATFD
jgi:hypothetical protein